MNITLSIDDEVMTLARRRAEALGTSVNALVRDYLAGLAGQSNRDTDTDRFLQLSQAATQSANPLPGWKFDREELHRRK